MMKAIFIGTVNFSDFILKEILKDSRIVIDGIVTKNKSIINSDFLSLKNIAQQKNIDTFIYDHNPLELEKWICQKHPDLIFCFGWSHLLPNYILKLPRHGVWGFHPAKLPKNRGRHPIIWTLARGLTETASTFFKMDKYADSGPIISQEIIKVDNQETSSTLYEKIKKVAGVQILEAIDKLMTGNLELIAQDESKATYWRKRTKSDGCIDWRMSENSILNLIRALTKPYPGATATTDQETILVWKASPYESYVDESEEPGKVIAYTNGNIVVKCGCGAIEILSSEPKIKKNIGEYLL